MPRSDKSARYGKEKGRFDRRGAEGPPGPSQRQLRVGELIRQVLADLLARGAVHDEVLTRRPVTIAEVRVSPDLKHATVFVAPLGGGDPAPVLEALTRAQRFLRGALGHEMRTKFTPDLRFLADPTFDQAEAIARLLHSPAVARDLAPGETPPRDDAEPEDKDAP